MPEGFVLSPRPRTWSPKVWSSLTVAAGACFYVLPAFAAITQCSGLCPGLGSTCIVQTSIDVVPGSFLNCTGKVISITGSGKITVTGGTFALSATSLSVGSGRSITATPSSTAQVGFEIDLTGAFTSSGRLAAQNQGGGSYIDIQTGGAIQVSGSASFPSIDISGSANSCDGGELYLSSGSYVDVSGRVDANGKDGGDETNANAGGVVDIIATGNVTIGQEVRAFGRFFDGGAIEIVSGGSVLVDYRVGASLPKGRIVVEGRNIDGYGGYVDITAADAITISGPIDGAGGTGNGGGYAAGAEVDLKAGCGGVLIDDNLDLTGGDDGGGILNVESDGAVTIASTIDARSRKYSGDGGSVVVTSGRLLTLDKVAIVNVDGHNTSTSGENGAGGVFIAQGCQVNLGDDATTGATITAQGYRGGAISLEGAKSSLSSTDYAVRVGDKTALTSTGESVQGTIGLQVVQRRFGSCSNNSAASCQTNSQCTFNGITGVCNNANPDTQGSLAQFSPAPTIVQTSSLPPCNVTCP